MARTEELEARILELEERLSDSEHRYSELLRGLTYIPSGVELYDHTGLACYLNPAMVRMTGLPSAEIALGKFNILTDAFSIETGLKPLYERAYAGEVVRTDEFVIEMDRASEQWGTVARQVWFKMVLVPLFDRSGGVESVFAIMFETTEHRNIKKALELVSRRDGIELLAGGAAHDYNNLLTAIMTTCELIRDISMDEEVLELNDGILDSVKQATFVTQQLLLHTIQRHQRVETVDLRDLTHSIIRAFHNALLQVGRLELELTDVPCLAEAEAGKYKQVVMNLLTNAMQALPPQGGVIAISLQKEQLDAKALEAFQFSNTPRHGSWNVLEIRDNGCGMHEGLLARIFEPYFTTKSTGSGLGLSSVLDIIWDHEGGVSIHSELGQGTCFRICLPTSQRVLPAVEVHPLKTVLPENARILLADNSPYLRGSLRALLERMGVEVWEASDGEEALERYAAAPTPPELALLDIMMPGLNGLDVLRELRSSGSEVPVLLMSTHHEMGRRAAADDPSAAFIEKPFTSAELIGALASLLDEGG